MELLRCGRRVTSNSFTSIRAVMPESVPWTYHTTRGKTGRGQRLRHLCDVITKVSMVRRCDLLCSLPSGL